eukprot:gene26207-biopygen14907
MPRSQVSWASDCPFSDVTHATRRVFATGIELSCRSRSAYQENKREGTSQ